MLVPIIAFCAQNAVSKYVYARFTAIAPLNKQSEVTFGIVPFP